MEALRMRCECGCSILNVEDLGDNAVSITILTTSPENRISRWRMIWNIFRKKNWYWGEVIEDKNKIADFFRKTADILDPPKKKKSYDMRIVREGKLKEYWD